MSELEAWEAQAVGDREWLIRLMYDKALAKVLGPPSDVYLSRILKTPQGRASLELYKSIPCSDTLLLYSDAQLVALGNNQACATEQSYIRSS